MSEAKEFFGNDEFSRDKSKRLASDHDKALQWEIESVSDFSPGIVQNDEVLARQIHSPIHIDNTTNKVTVAAFNDAFDKGLSTNRLAYASVREVHEAGEAKAIRDRERDSSRQYVGFIAADVSDIRALLDEHDPKRLFCVFDTGLPDAPHHADVCLVKSESAEGLVMGKKALKKERRRLLQEVFGELQAS